LLSFYGWGRDAAVAAIGAFLWTAIASWRSNRKSVLEDIIHHALAPLQVELGIINTALAVIRTKVDPMWAGWNSNITRNSAVLHHPEPSRARVDYLLDCLRSETITQGELTELRGHLETIMHWEYNKPAPYTIFQGEQAAAAAMLSALDVIHPETNDVEQSGDGLSYLPTDSPEEEGT
jgi:hypothetical protein